jgi:hypothetical protein
MDPRDIGSENRQRTRDLYARLDTQSVCSMDPLRRALMGGLTRRGSRPVSLSEANALPARVTLISDRDGNAVPKALP